MAGTAWPSRWKIYSLALYRKRLLIPVLDNQEKQIFMRFPPVFKGGQLIHIGFYLLLFNIKKCGHRVTLVSGIQRSDETSLHFMLRSVLVSKNVSVNQGHLSMSVNVNLCRFLHIP